MFSLFFQFLLLQLYFRSLSLYSCVCVCVQLIFLLSISLRSFFKTAHNTMMTMSSSAFVSEWKPSMRRREFYFMERERQRHDRERKQEREKAHTHRTEWLKTQYVERASNRAKISKRTTFVSVHLHTNIGLFIYVCFLSIKNYSDK